MLAASNIIIITTSTTTTTTHGFYPLHAWPDASQSLPFFTCCIISDFTSYRSPVLIPLQPLWPPCLSDGPDICLPQGLCAWSSVPPGIHLACSFPSFRSLPAYYNEVSLTTRPSTHHPLTPSISLCIWVVQCFLPSPGLELQEGCLCPLFYSLHCLAPVPRTGPDIEKVLRKILGESANE